MMKWMITDTLTGALERLEESMNEWSEPVKDYGESLVPLIERLTPEEEGYLMKSARENMRVEPTIKGVGLFFKMTGEKNPKRHPDFITKEGEKLDYALFQHDTYLRHPKPTATPRYLQRNIEGRKHMFYQFMGESLKNKLNSIRK